MRKIVVLLVEEQNIRLSKYSSRQMKEDLWLIGFIHWYKAKFVEVTSRVRLSLCLRNTTRRRAGFGCKSPLWNWKKGVVNFTPWRLVVTVEFHDSNEYFVNARNCIKFKLQNAKFLWTLTSYAVYNESLILMSVNYTLMHWPTKVRHVWTWVFGLRSWGWIHAGKAVAACCFFPRVC